MSITDPQQEVLAALVRDEYRDDARNVNFNDFAFDIAEKHQQSDEEIEDETVDESDEDFDETKLNVPNATQINNNPKLVTKMQRDERLTTHATLTSEVHELISLLEQEEIEIPEKFRKLASRPNLEVSQLRQLKIALGDLYDNKVTASYFTDWIIQLSVMVSTFFDGKTTIPFTDFSPNMTGYSARIKSQTNSLNKENTKLARKVNKKVGKSTTTVFKWASMIILPGIITIGINHGNKKLTDYDKHNNLDDDEEEEDADSRESSYESDEEEDDS